MDEHHFDALTRTVATDAGTRRTLLRVLAGSALAHVAARFGLVEDAKAKTRKTKRRKATQRKGQPERKAHGQLQAERNRKGNGKKRRKKPQEPPSPPPPSPPHPLDPPCSEDKRACPDGSCVDPLLCCEGEKPCGGGCIAATSCCPYTERQCLLDDTCVPKDQCCSSQIKCPGGECVGLDDCCHGQKLCFSTCVAKDACCAADPFPLCGPCEEVFCNQGSWACRRRSDLKQCPDGSCVVPDACCPGDQPQCGFCEVAACENGKQVCTPVMQECPGGMWDFEHCRCKYCEETCDPATGMCHSTCPEGHRCEEGKCLQNCDSPIRAQLCCIEEFPGQIRCACRFANEICYAFGGIAACVPNQTCCPPDAVRSGLCPEACREAEICQHCEGADCP
jgi:hypothetical protein